jgi:hypothetical protein
MDSSPPLRAAVPLGQDLPTPPGPRNYSLPRAPTVPETPISRRMSANLENEREP